MARQSSTVPVRLLFADHGEFHHETIRVAADRLTSYGRLIDFLREDPGVSQSLYIDFRRLVSARIEPGE